jgi:hypothetical protein
MSDTNKQQPRNIFEQILFGQLTVNNNIVALSKNVEILNDKIDDIMSVFSTQTDVVPESKHSPVKEEESVLND